MATTALPPLHNNSNFPHPARIFVGIGIIVSGIAVAGVLAEGGHYGGRIPCPPRFTMCSAPDLTWLPHGSEKEPSSPVTPTNVITAATTSSSVALSGSALVISTLPK